MPERRERLDIIFYGSFMNAYVYGLSVLFPLALVLMYDDNIALITTSDDKSSVSTTTHNAEERERRDIARVAKKEWWIFRKQWRRRCRAKWNKWKRKIEKICFSSPFTCEKNWFSSLLSKVRASNHRIYFSWMLLVNARHLISTRLERYNSLGDGDVSLSTCISSSYLNAKKILFQHEKEVYWWKNLYVKVKDNIRRGGGEIWEDGIVHFRFTCERWFTCSCLWHFRDISLLSMRRNWHHDKHSSQSSSRGYSHVTIIYHQIILSWRM